MSSKTHFKCLHCKEIDLCEPRSRGRQRYCSKPDCRRASKAASQRRWLSRPENANYFRGAAHCERVRRWREAHPGYWRRKKPAPLALQEAFTGQPPLALQDVCTPQPALIVGLIATITGEALQENIAASARLLLDRGADILRMSARQCAARPP
jgi:hypothetical protein